MKRNQVAPVVDLKGLYCLVQPKEPTKFTFVLESQKRPLAQGIDVVDWNVFAPDHVSTLVVTSAGHIESNIWFTDCSVIEDFACHLPILNDIAL